MRLNIFKILIFLFLSTSLKAVELETLTASFSSDYSYVPESYTDITYDSTTYLLDYADNNYSFYVSLNRASTNDVHVAFELNTAKSTATMETDTDEEEADFSIEVVEEDSDSYLTTWDGSTGYFKIEAGSLRSGVLTISIINDDIEEGNTPESIVFSIIEEQCLNISAFESNPDGDLDFTLYIEDDDPFYAEIVEKELSNREGDGSYDLKVVFPRPKYDIRIPYTIYMGDLFNPVEGEATSLDINKGDVEFVPVFTGDYYDDGEPIYDEFIQAVGYLEISNDDDGIYPVEAYISISPVNDTEVELVPEVFEVALGTPEYIVDEDDDTFVMPSARLLASSQRTTCVILDEVDRYVNLELFDNDLAEIGEEAELPAEISNGLYLRSDGQYGIRKNYSDGYLNLLFYLNEEAKKDVNIPVTISGDLYSSEEVPYTINYVVIDALTGTVSIEEFEGEYLTIEAGSKYVELLLDIDTDAYDIENSLSISMSDPYYAIDEDEEEDDTSSEEADSLLLLGDLVKVDIVFEIDPIPEFKMAALDFEGEFVYPDKITIAAGEYEVPFFVKSTGFYQEFIRYEFSILGDSTDAVLFDPYSDYDFDYWIRDGYLSNYILTVDEPYNFYMPPEVDLTPVYITTNSVEELDWDDGKPSMKTVTVEVSNAHIVDEDDLEIGDVTIVEGFETMQIDIVNLADYDVTEYFANDIGRPELQDIKYNLHTGFFDISYHFEPTDEFISQFSEIQGFRSLKFVFDLSELDSSSLPSDVTEAKEAIRATGDTIEYISAGTSLYGYSRPSEQHYMISSPIDLRFKNDIISEKIIDVDEKDQKIGAPINLDVYAYHPYVLYEIAAPVLDSILEESREGKYPEIGEAFTLSVEFAAPAWIRTEEEFLSEYGDRLEDLTVFLSRESVTDREPTTALARQIINKFEELEDGSMALQLITSYGSGSDNGEVSHLKIEYTDEDGNWIPAQPAIIRTKGTILNWVDNGLPKTKKHPSEVNLRLYRAIILD